MRISVSEKNIHDGKQKNSNACMIADAIKDRYPAAQFISVDLQSIRFTDTKRRKRLVYLTPPIAQLALVKFDLGAKVAPFDFRVDSPVKIKAMNSKTHERTARRRQLSLKHDRKYRKLNKAAKVKGIKRVRLHQREREFGLKLLDGQAV